MAVNSGNGVPLQVAAAASPHPWHAAREQEYRRIAEQLERESPQRLRRIGFTAEAD